MRFGSRMKAAATTGPASGPRPASSQPATGQTPFASARRSRRNVGRRTSSTNGRRSTCFADLAAAMRLIRAILRAHALKSNGTKFRPRAAGTTMAGETWLVRQNQPAIRGKSEARSLHHLPDVPVGIGKISAVAAVFGFLRTAQQAGANRQCLFENGIDLGRRRAI